VTGASANASRTELAPWPLDRELAPAVANLGGVVFREGVETDIDEETCLFREVETEDNNLADPDSYAEPGGDETAARSVPWSGE
jgi:hypothetical protein